MKKHGVRTVIDEEVILTSIKEEIENAKSPDSKEQQGNTTQEEDELLDIDLTKITTLALSFKSIYRIDHLKGFEKLVKLKLDNNVIKKIENLDHLVNLTWLDLSFNNIKKIEGLENLVHLTDLSLGNNNIEKIENLDNNKNLQILSLGNNQVHSVEDIIYLREFSSLKCLNLKGNPVYSKEEFKVTVFAYLKTLRHLDYERIKDSQIRQAREEKQAELLLLEQQEKQANDLAQESIDRAERVALLKSANIDIIETLFDDMMKDDADIPRLQTMTGFDQILSDFKEQTNELITEFVRDWMKRFEKKRYECNLFDRARSKIHQGSEKRSIEIIEEFQSRIKKNRAALALEEPGKLEKQDVESELDALMEIEMVQVDKINLLINDYEDRIDDLMRVNIRRTETFFAQIVDKETMYFNKTQELAASILEKIQDDKEDSMTRDAQYPQIINNAVQGSHDNHNIAIGRVEDDLVRREEKDKKDLIDAVTREEYKRNRQRVAEIYDCMKHLSGDSQSTLEQNEI